MLLTERLEVFLESIKGFLKLIDDAFPTQCLFTGIIFLLVEPLFDVPS